MKKFILLFLILKTVCYSFSQSFNYQFTSLSQKITIANKLPVEVYKNQIRYFWIINYRSNKWVIIQDKPVSESHKRSYFERFTLTNVQNLDNGCKRIWTFDGNNNRVIFYLDDQSVDPYILRTNNDVNGEIVKSVYYYIE